MNARQHLWIGSAATTTALVAMGTPGWAFPLVAVLPAACGTVRMRRRARWLTLAGALWLCATSPAGPVVVLATILGLWAAVFPDLDHHAAPSGAWGLNAFWRMTSTAGARIAGGGRWSPHRGLTHSLLAVIVTTALLAGLGWGALAWADTRLLLPVLPPGIWAWPAIAWGAGYLSHLIADSTTPSGIRWRLPAAPVAPVPRRAPAPTTPTRRVARR